MAPFLFGILINMIDLLWLYNITEGIFTQLKTPIKSRILDKLLQFNNLSSFTIHFLASG